MYCREGEMAPMSLLVFVIVGLVAGWIAGKVVRGAGFGLIGDIIVGIVGAFIGGWLRAQFHLIPIVAGSTLLNEIIYAALGAIILLLILRLIRRR
jgi:uncharacterized membrane protein YeaQ/YmgE (transglycosylase-associated protein family)